MKLYIDTSNKDVLKLSFGEVSREIETKRGPFTSDSTLIEIEKILKESNKKLSDITEIHVAPGPGSYTGLRVGYAISNALSFSLLKPLNGKGLGTTQVPVYS